MTAPRFARVIASTVHECAPDHSMHEILVGELREAARELTELYEAATELRMAQRAYMEVRKSSKDIRDAVGRAVASAAERVDAALELAGGLPTREAGNAQ